MPRRSSPAHLRLPLALTATTLLGCFDPGSDDGIDATTGSVSGAASSGGTTAAGSDDATAAESTSGEPASSGADSSDGGGPAPGCCVAGCDDACATLPCAETIIGTPTMGMEALDVVMVGENAAWASGNGKSVYYADIAAGTTLALVYVPDNAYVTRLAADASHVYFSDYDGGTIQRTAVPLGTLDLVSQVPGGTAGYGGVAVGATHVYFGMTTMPGIYRAAKDLSDAAQAEFVAVSPAPGAVAVDDTHVYWTEWNDPAGPLIRRLPFDAVGVTTEGTIVANGTNYIDELALDDMRVYYADGDAVKSALKLGTNQGLVTLAQGPVGHVAVDDSHVYWTSDAPATIQRVPKDGSGPAEVLATTTSPLGIALGCNAVYWTSNGTDAQSLRAAPK